MGAGSKTRVTTPKIFGGAAVLLFLSAAVLLVENVADRLGTAPDNPAVAAYAVPAVLPAGTRNVPWTMAVCNSAATPYSPKLSVDGTEVRIVSIFGTIPPGACQTVALELQAPETRTWISRRILDRANEIGQFGISTRGSEVVQQHLPVSIAESVEMVSVAARPAQILILSDKEVKHTHAVPVAWRLQAGPWHSSGVAEFTAGSRMLEVPVRGQSSWKRYAWQIWPFLKPGFLTLTAGRDRNSYPVVEKVFPVSVRLLAYDPYAQGTVTAVLAFLPLLAGGLLAYFLQTVVPQMRRRQKVLDTLDDIEDELVVLYTSPSAYPDVALLVAEEVRRTRSFVKSFFRFSPELKAELDKLEGRVGALRLKATALRRACALPTEAGRGLGLLALERVRSALRIVVNELRAAREDTQRLDEALTNLDEAEVIVRGAGEEQAVIVDELTRECTALGKDLQAVETDRVWEPIRNLLARDIASVKLGAVRSGECWPREFTYWKVRVAVDLFRRNPDPSKIQTVLASVREGDWAGMANLRPALAKDEDVMKCLKSGTGVEIVTNRKPIRERELVSFSLWFHDDRLNYSRVRERQRLLWQFGSAEFEAGWTVWRWFPTTGQHSVEVRLAEESARVVAPGRPFDCKSRVGNLGHMLLGAARPRGSDAGKDTSKVPSRKPPAVATATVRVTRRRQQYVTQPWLSTIGVLLAVQTIPLFALLSTNIDVIRTRDPFSAIVILIAVGFGTDTGRRLLSSAATAVASGVTTAGRNRPTQQVVTDTADAAVPDVGKGSDLHAAMKDVADKK